MHTKSVNPNLPEMIDEQVQQVYDAYNAGAVLHISTPAIPRTPPR